MTKASLKEAESVARGIAKKIDAATPDGWGFVLMLFEWGKGGMATYISNGQRADIIKAIRELADRIERKEV